MKDPQGNVARKAGTERNPVVVHNQEEEDKLPMGIWVTSPDGDFIERKGSPKTFRANNPPH